MWTHLLASNSSLGRPIGAPRVFFNSKYLFLTTLQILSYPTTPVGDTATITHDLVKKYTLLSSSNYKTFADLDIPKKDLFGQGQKPWTQDAGQLHFLCNINPMCVGYTSEGFLKNSTKGIQPKVGVTLYLKV